MQGTPFSFYELVSVLLRKIPFSFYELVSVLLRKIFSFLFQQEAGVLNTRKVLSFSLFLAQVSYSVQK